MSPPTLSSLRSSDEKSSAAAWRVAYDFLYEAGRAVAVVDLVGGNHESDREDIVIKALAELSRGVITFSSESYNQLSTFDDVIRMMRKITRNRIDDFFRSKGRRKEDAVEFLPEPAVETTEHPFRMDELLPEIDKLLPNPPVPQVFRDRFLEGWSTDEIAARRKLNRNTLLTYFAKGLRTLRERLLQLDPQP